MINVCMIFFIKTEIKIIKFCIFFKRMTVVGESIVEFIIIKQKKIYQYIQNGCECFCKMFFGKNDDTSVHFT